MVVVVAVTVTVVTNRIIRCGMWREIYSYWITRHVEIRWKNNTLPLEGIVDKHHLVSNRRVRLRDIFFYYFSLGWDSRGDFSLGMNRLVTIQKIRSISESSHNGASVEINSKIYLSSTKSIHSTSNHLIRIWQPMVIEQCDQSNNSSTLALKAHSAPETKIDQR